MPRSNAITTRYEWYVNHFFCSEAFQMYAYGALTAYLGRRSGFSLPESEEGLRTLFHNYSQIWLPAFTSVLINTSNNYFTRIRELRNSQGHQQSIKIQDLEFHQKAGEQALTKKQFLLAEEHYDETLNIFKDIHGQDQRSRAAQLYLHCLYRKTVALYAQNKYVESKNILNQTLKNPQLSGMNEIIPLLNLRGLIYFSEGSEPVYDEGSKDSAQRSFWTLAEKDFIRSYKMDSSQNSVFFYLQYLQGNYKFLSDNVPNDLFNPQMSYIFHENDVIVDHITMLCADASFREGKLQQAICLYNASISSLPVNPSLFLDLFGLHLRLFLAYRLLLEKNAKQQDVLLFIIEEVRGSEKDKVPLKESPVPLEDVKKLAAKSLIDLISFLDSVLFLDDETQARSFVMNRINYAYAFELLNKAMNDYKAYPENYETPKTDRLKQKFTEQLNLAKKIAGTSKDCTALKPLIQNILKETDNTISSIECDDNTTTLYKTLSMTASIIAPAFGSQLRNCMNTTVLYNAFSAVAPILTPAIITHVGALFKK